MIPVEIGGEKCDVIFMTSTSKLFELLLSDAPISTHYSSPLIDRGVYIVNGQGDKLLRLECEGGKKALLETLRQRRIWPQTLLDLYLEALFNVLDAVKVSEKPRPQYYVIDRLVEPTKIEIKDHPAGFGKGSYTLIDRVVSRNYRILKIEGLQKLNKVLYNPVEAFSGKVLGNAILLFDRKDLRELGLLHFEDYLTARELFLHTTDFYLSGILWGHIKFKIREFLEI